MKDKNFFKRIEVIVAVMVLGFVFDAKQLAYCFKSISIVRTGYDWLDWVFSIAVVLAISATVSVLSANGDKKTSRIIAVFIGVLNYIYFSKEVALFDDKWQFQTKELGDFISAVIFSALFAFMGYVYAEMFSKKNLEESEMEFLRTENLRLNQENENLKGEKSKLETEYQTAQTEISRLTDQTKKRGLQVFSLIRVCRKLAEDKRNLGQELEEKIGEIEDLKLLGDARELRNSLDESERLKVEAQSKLTTISNSLELKEIEIQTLNAKIKILNAETMLNNQTIEEANEKIAELEKGVPNTSIRINGGKIYDFENPTDVDSFRKLVSTKPEAQKPQFEALLVNLKTVKGFYEKANQAYA